MSGAEPVHRLDWTMHPRVGLVCPDPDSTPPIQPCMPGLGPWDPTLLLPGLTCQDQGPRTLCYLCSVLFTGSGTQEPMLPLPGLTCVSRYPGTLHHLRWTLPARIGSWALHTPPPPSLTYGNNGSRTLPCFCPVPCR